MKKETKLKAARNSSGHWITQREVAEAAGISLRTYQDYEQGRKDINGASAFTVYRLAVTLTNLTDHKWTVEDLLEIDHSSPQDN